jgi:hypothetical protein
VNDIMDTIAKIASRHRASDLVKRTCSMAARSVDDYNTKLLEIIQANTTIAFDSAQKLLSTKSPSEFMKLSIEQTHKQLETLTEQIRELTELGQKVTLATTDPFRTGLVKTFSRSA